MIAKPSAIQAKLPMPSFELSRLWQRSLSARADEYASERDHLRTVFLRFRKRAADLASEIARDIPSLTNHDIEHIDALWLTAGLIIGDQHLNGPEPFLNPLEAFVLGGAFLVHDLAHSRFALDQTDEELHRDPMYLDVLSDVVKNREVAVGVKSDPTAQDRVDALALYLRAKHASVAQTLSLRFWTDDRDDRYFLLDDDELRDAVGEAIGKVAASHHWPTTKLAEYFGVVGGPTFLPNAWKLDLLKLACIIRLADAAQIDSRRAPTFLRVLRAPEGLSKLHWDFQQKINQPIVEGDRIIFSSASSFPLALADAWWVGFDLLKIVDRELVEVDSLLADNGRARFAIRTVAGIHEPQRLAKYIPTNGWQPVDTQIRVGNVASLVTRLGGEQLYGNNSVAPLRELIQNASDSVRARRLIESQQPNWGFIDVALEQDHNHWILKVEDTGIGMSEEVLTGPLLDFGTSFWATRLASEEYPGLRGKGFEPTGRYGIGFFSVFMLGSRVKIISRRLDLGAGDTRVLEFSEGAYARPILRRPNANEYLLTGTRVEVVLKIPPKAPGGILASLSHDIFRGSLADLCSWLIPASEVTVRTRENGKAAKTVIKARDWLTMSPRALLNRTEKIQHSPRANPERTVTRHSANIRPLYSEHGSVIGRACIRLESEEEATTFRDAGLISVGGARAESLDHVAGIIEGVSRRAARDRAEASVSPAEALRWAEEQRALVESCSLSDEIKFSVAAILRASGVETATLPIAECRNGWLSEAQVVSFARNLDHVLLSSHLYMRFGAGISTGSYAPELLLSEHGVGSGIGIGNLERGYTNAKWPAPEYYSGALSGVIVRALSTAWSCSERQVLEAADHSTDDVTFTAQVGYDSYNNPVLRNAMTIFFRPGVARSFPPGYKVDRYNS